jgi:hypothetical protein
MTLVTLSVKSAAKKGANQAKYNQNGRSYDNQISNQVLARIDSVGYESIQTCASYLGIDLGAADYTFSVNYTRTNDGYDQFISEPQVCLFDGVPSILWGNTSIPLSEVKGTISFAKGEKAIYLVVGSEDDADTWELPVRLKDRDIDVKVLNKARKGQDWAGLGLLLERSFKKTHVSQVAKNVPLTLLNKPEKNSFGKYEFELPGYGLVVGNTKMNREYLEILDNQASHPELAQEPIYLLFGADKKTRDGRDYTEVTVYQEFESSDEDLDLFLSY